LKVGAIGCGSVVTLAVIAIGAIVAVTFQGYQRELDALEELDAKFGAFDSYRMPAGGTLPAERLERFLAVRRALVPRCAEITEFTGAFKEVEAAATAAEPDAGSLFHHAGNAIGRVPRLGLVFGAYLNDRNQALLRQGMGLGEYTWLYVAGYFGLLNQVPARLFVEPERKKVLEDRVYPETAKVIERHVQARALTGGPWVEELARLRAGAGLVPFSAGLPPELARSLEPFRGALAEAGCPAAAELDLTITVRRGVAGYDHR
jgi:hypothetical protein